MSDGALALITGVRARCAASRSRRLSPRLSQPPVAARGHCHRLSAVQGRERAVLFVRVRADACSPAWTLSPRASRSCRRCDGTGLLTCNKCRGYGYMKKGPDDKCGRGTFAGLPALTDPRSVRAFRQSEDVSNIYLCPFCNGGGTAQCTGCRGAAKLWPSQGAPPPATPASLAHAARSEPAAPLQVAPRAPGGGRAALRGRAHGGGCAQGRGAAQDKQRAGRVQDGRLRKLPASGGKRVNLQPMQRLDGQFCGGVTYRSRVISFPLDEDPSIDMFVAKAQNMALHLCRIRTSPSTKVPGRPSSRLSVHVRRPSL